VRRIDEESGDLLTTTREELAAAFSVNLLLDRPAQTGASL